MSKSADAFRTISEVADWLGIQAHVLRFWESKFTQVKPIKRAGGRRYYRPADMQLLGGIKKLLHDDGLTIKGVQKILREEGMSHVASLSAALDDADLEMEANAFRAEAQTARPAPVERAAPVVEEAVVLPFTAQKEPEKAAVAEIEIEAVETPATTEAEAPLTRNEDAPDVEALPRAAATKPETEPQAATPDPLADPETVIKSEPVVEPKPVEAREPAGETAPDAAQDQVVEALTPDVESAEAAPLRSETIPAPGQQPDPAPQTAPEPEAAPEAIPEAVQEAMPEAVQETQALPSFMRKPDVQPETPSPGAEAAESVSARADQAQDDTPPPPSGEQADVVAGQLAEVPPAPKARNIGMPPLTAPQDMPVQASLLSRTHHIRALDAAQIREIQPLLAQLAAVRDRMAARRNSAAPKT